MDYILLFPEDNDAESLPQLFLVSQMAINHAHSLEKSATIDLQPISIDIVPGGICVMFDRVLWLTPEVEREIRSAYNGYVALWKSEIMIPLELVLVKQKFKQAGYIRIG